MAQDINRRQAIWRLGATTAGLVGGSQLYAADMWLRTPQDLEQFAARVRDVPADKTLTFAAEQIAQGASWQELLAAVFLAGARDIRPRPHGILHTVMMVESTFQLADAAAAPRDAWHLALFNLQDFKASQARDIRENNNYLMQPIAVDRTLTGAAAKKEFAAAMTAFDAKRAEHAVVQLLPHVSRVEFFELFRPFAVRCYAFIGHKMIYATHAERVLQRIGWQYAEAPLRSLVLACLVNRDTTSFDRVRKLTETLPTKWLELAGGDGQAVFDELRTSKPEDAPTVVIQHMKRGLDTSRAWDAIVRLGSLIFQRRPGRRSADGRTSLLPVHALTVPNAMRTSFLRSRDEDTKKLLLLQAASWTVSLRDDLANMVNLSMKTKQRIDARQEPESLDDAFASSSPSALRALMQRDERDLTEASKRLRASLVRTGSEHHQHKYAAAMFEEAERVEESLRPTIIAAAIDYLANHQDRETEFHRKANTMLAKAKVR
ncbi:MAG: hypothetical protein ACI91B_002881 [Planctomycetota bacterium]